MSTSTAETPAAAPGPLDASTIRAWMVDYLAGVLNVDPGAIDTAAELERLGLNSALVVSMMGDLEDWLGVELSPSVVFDYPTIDLMAAHLEGRVGR
jgi:acyl carrier protein